MELQVQASPGFIWGLEIGVHFRKFGNSVCFHFSLFTLSCWCDFCFILFFAHFAIYPIRFYDTTQQLTIALAPHLSFDWVDKDDLSVFEYMLIWFSSTASRDRFVNLQTTTFVLFFVSSLQHQAIIKLQSHFATFSSLHGFRPRVFATWSLSLGLRHFLFVLSLLTTYSYLHFLMLH